MQGQLQSWWGRYRDTHDPRTREQLILHYAPLVKYVAGRVAVGMPSHVEHSDLISYGIFGLMDAIDKFDPGRGYKFETYAVTRIRGAIIDELRSVDWVPRSVRAKARRLEVELARLEAELLRTPTDEELAAAAGMGIEELQQTLTRMSMTSLVALDEVFDLGENGEGVSLGDTLQDLTTVMPEESLDEQETRRMLREAVGRLSEREQTVLGLYYLEGLTLAQVGDVLGVTESRICQIHTKAVMSLRAKLTERIRG